MMLLVVFGALIGVGDTRLPTVDQIAAAVSHANYKQMWTKFQGDALTASALATHDLDQIRAAMLLAGAVMGRGFARPVDTNGLSALCEIVMSNGVRDELFSQKVFQAKQFSSFVDQRLQSPHYVIAREGLTVLQNRPRESHYLTAQEAAALFPFTNLPYVCGNDIPLSIKVWILKARMMQRIVNGEEVLDKYRIHVPSDRAVSSFDSLENICKHRIEVVPRRGLPELAQLGFLLELVVEQDGFPGEIYLPGESSVYNWLSRVVGNLFPSQFFKRNSNDEFRLVLGRNDANCYLLLGELIGSAILNDVPIGVSLDPRLIRAILSDAYGAGHNEWPNEAQQVRNGFYESVSMAAIWGNLDNPRTLFSEQELSDVFRGRY